MIPVNHIEAAPNSIFPNLVFYLNLCYNDRNHHRNLGESLWQTHIKFS